MKPDVETLRIAMDRLGIGQSDEAWLARIANEVEALEEMVRKLDDLDLSSEEPGMSVSVPRRGALDGHHREVYRPPLATDNTARIG